MDTNPREPRKRSPFPSLASRSLWRPLLAKPHAELIFSRPSIFSTVFCVSLVLLSSILFLFLTYFGFILLFLSWLLQVEFYISSFLCQNLLSSPHKHVSLS